jgi:hypothetical protein
MFLPHKNTPNPHYTNQYVIVLKESNLYLFWESYKTQKYIFG